jgi:hypothetical protein
MDLQSSRSHVQADSAPPSPKSRFVAGHPPFELLDPDPLPGQKLGKHKAKICTETRLVLVASGKPPIVRQVFSGEGLSQQDIDGGDASCAWSRAVWCDCARALLFPIPTRCNAASSIRPLGTLDLGKLWSVLAGIPRARRGVVLLTALPLSPGISLFRQSASAGLSLHSH